MSPSLISAINGTAGAISTSGSTINPGATMPYDPVVSDDPSKVITHTPVPKNVYGASVDIENAKGIFGVDPNSYNYIQTDLPGFEMPEAFKSSDIILGGINTPGGIGDVPLNGAIRLAGMNRNLTAQAINNYLNPKNVYGTGVDINNARNILGDIGYRYIQTDSSYGFDMTTTFTSDDIILGGPDTIGGIGDIDLNGAIRLYGNNRDETAQAVRDYSISKNVYGTGADLKSAENILGSMGYNYIDTGKSGYIWRAFTCNDIILGGTNTAGGIGDVNLNGAVRLAGATRDLTAQMILNYDSPKNVYGTAVDITNAKSILGNIGYNYIQTDAPGFTKPASFNSDDIILGGVAATGIQDSSLNGAIRLAGANRDETASLIRNYSTAKNVYGTAVDLANAKTILGATGYNYIDTDIKGFVRPMSFTSNDIILGGTKTTGGIVDVNLNGAVRLSGANRALTAQSINNYRFHKNVYGTAVDIANAKDILGTSGYNYIQTDAPGFTMPSSFHSNDIILGGIAATGIPDSKLNGAIRLAGANRDETANLITNYATAKNVYGTGTDLANAKSILGTIGYNYIDTGKSGFIMPTFTSNDIIIGGTATAGGIGNVNLNGALRLSGTNAAGTLQAIKDYAGIKDPVSAPENTNTNFGLLVEGSTGDAVKQLQSDLLYLGYNPNGIDGVFGDNTKAAVMDFQRDYGCTVDGKVGTETEHALSLALNGKAPSVSSDTGYLQIGSTGAAVTALQIKLSILGFYKYTIDGQFGKNTCNAVKELQSDFGLRANGIADPRTMNALNKAIQESGLSDDPYGKVPEINLEYGDTGDSVKRLQCYLNFLGYDTCGIDGKFGTATFNAVKTFQIEHDLNLNGKVDAKTWSAINQSVNLRNTDIHNNYVYDGGNWLYDLLIDLNVNLTKTGTDTIAEADAPGIHVKVESEITENLNNAAPVSIGDGSVSTDLSKNSTIQLNKDSRATASVKVSKDNYDIELGVDINPNIFDDSTIFLSASYTPEGQTVPSAELKVSFSINNLEAVTIAAAATVLTICTDGGDIEAFDLASLPAIEELPAEDEQVIKASTKAIQKVIEEFVDNEAA